jgi:hypothetical protein
MAGRPSRKAVIAVSAFLGLLVLTLVWAVAFGAINDGLRQDFDAKTQLVEKLRRQAALVGNRGNGQGNESAQTISATTETIAASELQKTLLTSLDSAGGTVRSIQSEAATNLAEEGLRHLSAQITFDGSIEALQEFLFVVETAVPYIFVDSMIVQPSSTQAAGNEPTRLRVTLVASSYWKMPERTN